MYLTFRPEWRQELEEIQQEIQTWANRHRIRYSTKFIKGVLRVGFDRESDFTLFTMTWAPDLEKMPYLDYKIVKVQNEKY